MFDQSSDIHVAREARIPETTPNTTQSETTLQVIASANHDHQHYDTHNRKTIP
jgi:hypothetical protein